MTANLGMGAAVTEGGFRRHPRVVDGALIRGPHIAPRLKPGLGQHCAEAYRAKRLPLSECPSGQRFAEPSLQDGNTPTPGWLVPEVNRPPESRPCPIAHPARAARTPPARRRREIPGPRAAAARPRRAGARSP